MSRFHLVQTAAVAVLLVAGTTARADTVSDWFEFDQAVEEAGTDKDAPFAVDTYLAGTRTELAMFEAADSVDRRYASFLHVPTAAAGASGPIAVATAARDVLLSAFPAQKAMIEDRYCLALAEERDGPSKAAGIAAGHAAAAAALKAGGSTRPQASFRISRRGGLASGCRRRRRRSTFTTLP